MKIDYQSPARLELRQNHGIIGLALMAGVILPLGAGLALAEKTPSIGVALAVIGLPLAIVGGIVLLILGSSLHISLDRTAGLATLRWGSAFRKRVQTYPLDAVEGARILTIASRKRGQKPGLRPLLMIREGDRLAEIPLASLTTTWDSNRDAVDAINTWLAARPAA